MTEAKYLRERTLSDLLADGLIKPNARLSASYKGQTFIATVTKDGKVRLEDGYEGSPSGAASHCTGTSVNGWQFWRIGHERLGSKRG